MPEARIGIGFEEDGLQALIDKIQSLFTLLEKLGSAGGGGGGGTGAGTPYSHPSQQPWQGQSQGANVPPPHQANREAPGTIAAGFGAQGGGGGGGGAAYPGASGSITIHAQTVNIQAATVNLAGGVPGAGGGPGAAGAGGGVPGAGVPTAGGVAFDRMRAYFNVGTYASTDQANAAADQLLALRVQHEDLRNQRLQQQVDAGQGGGVGGGLKGILGQVGRMVGVWGAVHAAAGAIGLGAEVAMSGGDQYDEHWTRRAISGIPILGSVLAPIFNPMLEKREAITAAGDIARYMLGPRRGGFEAGLGDSPMALSAATNLMLQGIPIGRGILDAFNQPRTVPRGTPGAQEFISGTGMQATSYFQNPNWIPPAMRGPIMDAYARTLSSPFGWLASRYGRTGRDDTEPFATTWESAYAAGDWQTAQTLFGAAHPEARFMGGGGGSMAGMAFQFLADSPRFMETIQQGIFRPQERLYGARAGAALAAGDIPQSIRDVNTQQRRLQSDLVYQQQLIDQQETFNRYVGEQGNRQAMLAGRQRLYTLQTGAAEMEEQLARSQTSIAGLPLQTELRSEMSRAGFAVDVLSNIPGSYGNLRGALRYQMGLQESAAGEIWRRYRDQSARGELTPEAGLAYQERLQDIGRQQSATFQQLSFGWEHRLISMLMGMPGSFNMAARGFAFRDAVGAGVWNPHMGATREQIPFFMRMANRLNFPVIPGYRGPFQLPGGGRGGALPPMGRWPGGGVPSGFQPPGGYPGGVARGDLGEDGLPADFGEGGIPAEMGGGIEGMGGPEGAPGEPSTGRMVVNARTVTVNGGVVNVSQGGGRGGGDVVRAGRQPNTDTMGAAREEGPFFGGSRSPYQT